jgi:hypothetical protein
MMSTTRRTIREWFASGKANQHDRMLIICDTFDHEDYPVYCLDSDFPMCFRKHNGVNMQRIMEVYDLHADREEQINQPRVWNCPDQREIT